jgi:hypothetical protein
MSRNQKHRKTAFKAGFPCVRNYAYTKPISWWRQGYITSNLPKTTFPYSACKIKPVASFSLPYHYDRCFCSLRKFWDTVLIPLRLFIPIGHIPVVNILSQSVKLLLGLTFWNCGVRKRNNTEKSGILWSALLSQTSLPFQASSCQSQQCTISTVS